MEEAMIGAMNKTTAMNEATNSPPRFLIIASFIVGIAEIARGKKGLWVNREPTGQLLCSPC